MASKKEKASEKIVPQEELVEIEAESTESQGVLDQVVEEGNEATALDTGFEVSIMALDSKTQIQNIATDLGNAWDKVKATYTSGDSSDSKLKVSNARQTVVTQMTTSEYDNAEVLAKAFRDVEKKIDSTVKPVLKGCCDALETYTKNQHAKKFRDKWNATSTGTNDPTWPANFRELWRLMVNEELIVKVAHVTKASGSWPATMTSDTAIVLDENLEIRFASSAGTSTDEIVATLVLQKADLTTSIQTVTIPVGTTVGTRFTIGSSSTKGITITNVSIATDNGVNGDELQLWVKSAA